MCPPRVWHDYFWGASEPGLTYGATPTLRRNPDFTEGFCRIKRFNSNPFDRLLLGGPEETLTVAAIV